MSKPGCCQSTRQSSGAEVRAKNRDRERDIHDERTDAAIAAAVSPFPARAASANDVEAGSTTAPFQPDRDQREQEGEYEHRTSRAGIEPRMPFFFGATARWFWSAPEEPTPACRRYREQRLSVSI